MKLILRYFLIFFLLVPYSIFSLSSPYFFTLKNKHYHFLPDHFNHNFKLGAPFYAKVNVILILKNNLNYHFNGNYYINPYKILKLNLFDFNAFSKIPVIALHFNNGGIDLYLNLEGEKAKQIFIQNYKNIPDAYNKFFEIPIPYLINIFFYKLLMIENPNFIEYTTQEKFNKILLKKKSMQEILYYNNIQNILEKKVIINSKLKFSIRYSRYFLSENLKIPQHIEYKSQDIHFIMILSSIQFHLNSEKIRNLFPERYFIKKK